MKLKTIIFSFGIFYSFAAAAQDLPQKEKTFIDIVSAAISQSDNAKNDMQRGGIKARRDDGVCSALKKRAVSDWVGKVTTIDSNSDGKGVIEIEVADNITLKTWNNSLSDISDHTLIDPRSKLFEKASMLSVGDSVKFSGEFFRGAESCIEEASMSLRGGLEEPEFIFRFKDITKI
ncbi:hypothetical protein [Mangrovibacter phragmitis]|uniref:hypothetical protein n=1 Tax=Mangrovibacter phragmitis TaxID=1691903 RepID=UPI0035118287